MKSIYPIIFLLFACAFTLSIVTCTGKSDSSDRNAPDFMLSDIEGNRFYLSEQKCKAVVLNFWSIHCAPCLVEMPGIQQLSDSLSKKGVRFVGICNDPGEGNYVESLLKRLGVTYTNLIDEQKAVSEKYSVTALPSTFIIDYRGKIRYHTVGYDERYLNKYRNLLEMILHEYETEKP